MKFEEKLMKLRKEKGLSQEELGEQLNVTRQTISKWELGQTTPEMDSLVEISNFFGVSVNDLINDTESSISSNSKEKTQDKEYNKEENNNKRSIIIICILCAVLVGCIIYGINYFYKSKNEQKNEQKAENIIDKVIEVPGKILDSDMIDKFIETQDKILDSSKKMAEEFATDYQNNVDKMKEEYDIETKNMAEQLNKVQNEWNEESNKNSHNSTFEKIYTGVLAGTHVKAAINKVISINQKEIRKITVTYNDSVVSNNEEIAKISSKIDLFKEYSVIYDYDDDGYICNMNIKNM